MTSSDAPKVHGWQNRCAPPQNVHQQANHRIDSFFSFLHLPIASPSPQLCRLRIHFHFSTNFSLQQGGDKNWESASKTGKKLFSCPFPAMAKLFYVPFIRMCLCARENFPIWPHPLANAVLVVLSTGQQGCAQLPDGTSPGIPCPPVNLHSTRAYRPRRREKRLLAICLPIGGLIVVAIFLANGFARPSLPFPSWPIHHPYRLLPKKGRAFQHWLIPAKRSCKFQHCANAMVENATLKLTLH